MSKKDKQDLIEAICGYLPYAVYIDFQGIQGICHEIRVLHYFNNTNTVQELDAYIDFFGDNDFIISRIKICSNERCRPVHFSFSNQSPMVVLLSIDFDKPTPNT